MKNKKIIIPIIFFVIIAVILILVFVTKKSNNPEDLIYSHKEVVIDNLYKLKESTNYKTIFENECYETEGTLIVNAEVNGENLEKINKMKIQVEGKTDNLEGKSYKKYILEDNEKNKIFNFETLRLNNIYAITSKQVVNLYLAIKDDELAEVLSKGKVQEKLDFLLQLEALKDIKNMKEEKFKSLVNSLYGESDLESVSSSSDNGTTSITIKFKNEIKTLIITTKENEVTIKLSDNGKNYNFNYKIINIDEQAGEVATSASLNIQNGNSNILISYNEINKKVDNAQIQNLEVNNNCVMLNNYSDKELQNIIEQIENRLNSIFEEVKRNYNLTEEVDKLNKTIFSKN